MERPAIPSEADEAARDLRERKYKIYKDLLDKKMTLLSNLADEEKGDGKKSARTIAEGTNTKAYLDALNAAIEKAQQECAASPAK